MYQTLTNVKSGAEWKDGADVCWTQLSCRQPDRQRMNDLWKKIDLMMLGYLSSLTYSVFIHLLTLSLHHPSLTHSLLHPLAASLLFFLCLAFSLSHTLMLPLSPSPQTVTVCFIRSRCRQLREIKCNMAQAWGKKKTALIVEQIVVRAKLSFSADSEHWERHTEFSLGPAAFSGLGTVIYQLPLVIVCPAFVYWLMFPSPKRFLWRHWGSRGLKSTVSLWIFYVYFLYLLVSFLHRTAELLCPSLLFQSPHLPS